MKALILAAGEGNRLRELTKQKPKAILQIAACMPNVPHILEETSKTYEEMKTTMEKLCKNCVYFKIRKGNTYCSLLKQKVPETYFCGKFTVYQTLKHTVNKRS